MDSIIITSDVQTGSNINSNLTAAVQINSNLVSSVIHTSDVSATGPQGPQGEPGIAGSDGADGQGVPTGGTTGQVLAKNSNDDYDTEWVNQSGGGGSANWGDIGGNLSDQTDLQAEFDELEEEIVALAVSL